MILGSRESWWSLLSRAPKIIQFDWFIAGDSCSQCCTSIYASKTRIKKIIAMCCTMDTIANVSMIFFSYLHVVFNVISSEIGTTSKRYSRPPLSTEKAPQASRKMKHCSCITRGNRVFPKSVLWNRYSEIGTLKSVLWNRYSEIGTEN